MFSIPRFPPVVGTRLTSGQPGVYYEIVDTGPGRGGGLGEGAKGVAFKARVEGGSDCGDYRVIKFPKLDLDKYGLEATRARVEVIHRAQRTEMLASVELGEIEGAAPILDVQGGPWYVDYQGHQEMINLIHTVYKFIDGETLFQWCQRQYGAGGTFSGIPDAELWFRLARRLFTILDEVHCLRVVHGDIWPDNIMMSDDGQPTIIDFGEGWSMSHQLDSTAFGPNGHEYLAPERYENATETGRWYSSADLYSMGGVLFYLATGQKPPLPFQADTRTRRRGRDMKMDIIRIVKDHNKGLYERQPGVVDVILMCMRPKVADRARHAGEVIETIETIRGFDPSEGLQGVIDEVGNLNKALRDLQSKPLANNPIIQRVVLRGIRGLHHDTRTLRSRVFSIDGGRESHVNGLLACVGALGPGDELLAVTSTRFWRKENFGPYGRLTSMLIAAAMRGADINWQLLLDPDFESDDQQVLAYQRVTVEEYKYCAGLDAAAYAASGLYRVGFHKPKSADLRQVRRERGTFVLLRNGDRWTLAAADYSDERGALSVVRLWDSPKRLQALRDRHSEWARQGTPILDYTPPLP